MSVGSDHPGVLRSLPLLALEGTAWVMLCVVLRNVAPAAWAWGGWPAAVLVGTAAAAAGERWNLRTAVILAGIALSPLLMRLFAGFAGETAAFDNGWLLTFPLWYAAAVFHGLSRRHPRSGLAETILLALSGAVMLSLSDDWGRNLTAPAEATLRLTAAVFILVLAALSLAALASHPAGRRRRSGREKPSRKRSAASRRSGAPRAGDLRPGGRGPVLAGRIVHGLVLAAALVLLLLAGDRIRRDRTLEAGGGVLAGDLFRFDFNDVLSLEPEISLNAELTMLYREDGPAVTRYLRRFTLSGWDDARGFYRDGERETDVPGLPAPPSVLPRGPETWDTGDSAARIRIRQEYYLIALDPGSFFALNQPAAVEPWVIWDDASFSRAYAAESMVSVAGPWELYDAPAGGMDSEWRAYYLRGGDDEDFLRLAEEAAGDAPGPWAAASALERWFRDNFYYSLKPGVAADGDQLSRFLEDTHRGYCSYFAFAMTRMCRALGIPARVAVGFVTDPEGSALGFVPVRSDQAHAWVEIWLDEFGWIAFDPTSETMAPGEEYPVRFMNPDEWIPLVEEVLTRSGEVSIALDDEPEDSAGFWHRLTKAVRRRAGRSWILLPVLLLAVYLPRRIIPGLRYLRARYSADLRKRRIAAWRRFGDGLVRCGRGPGRDETPLDWARRLERTGPAGFEEWTRLYLKAVFASDFDGTDAAAADEAAAAVLTAWKSMSRRSRLIARIGPGWRGRLPW